MICWSNSEREADATRFSMLPLSSSIRRQLRRIVFPVGIWFADDSFLPNDNLNTGWMPLTSFWMQWWDATDINKHTDATCFMHAKLTTSSVVPVEQKTMHQELRTDTSTLPHPTCAQHVVANTPSHTRRTQFICDMRLHGPLRGHGFDMGMIFANRPHVRGCAWVSSSPEYDFRKKGHLRGAGWPHVSVSHVWFQILNFPVIKLVPYWNLMPSFFNPRLPSLCSLVLLKIVLLEWKKRCFRLQNTRDLLFLEKTQGCTTQNLRVGMLKFISNLFRVCFKLHPPLACVHFPKMIPLHGLTWPLVLHASRKSYPCKGKEV